jgi:hypothetical protein
LNGPSQTAKSLFPLGPSVAKSAEGIITLLNHHFKKFKIWTVACVTSIGISSQSAIALDPTHTETASPPARPAVGGHAGFGFALMNFGTPPTAWIGRDFFLAGPVIGIDYHFDPHWSVDFQLLMLSQWLNTAAFKPGSIFVMSPGVSYNWGPIITGLSVIGRTSETGAYIGFSPILVKTFGSGPLLYFLELDLPLFVQGPTPTTSGATITMTPFLQFGVGF